MGGRKDVFRVGRKLHVLAVEVYRFFFSFILYSESLKVLSYQMALCPSARVLRHCPEGKLHIRLRVKYMNGDETWYVYVNAHEAIERA